MTNKREWLTAKQVNEMALRMCTYRSDGSKRSLPTIEQAQEYDEIVVTLVACYMGYQGELTDDEVSQMQRREEEFDHLQLDMRYQVFEENGKRGLRHPSGYVVVPPLFDDIAEQYDALGKRWGPTFAVPVIREGKYALYVMGRPQDQEFQEEPLTEREKCGKLVTEFEYDNMYKFFGTPGFFIVEKDGKKGVLDSGGNIIVPIEQDEIYEQMDTDGCFPFICNGKWGVSCHGKTTDAEFVDVIIQSEDFVRVKVEGDDTYYYLDDYGNLTTKRHEAYFGSWCDLSK